MQMTLTQRRMRRWEPPSSFDEYQIVRKLGRGGMGTVYLAKDTLLNRSVAIKFISTIDPSATVRSQFLIEARAAARIQHPNVVSIYRVGELQGHPYIVTEYVRGKTLQDMPKPMTWRRAVDIAIGLARGLASAHRHGVLHHDIKPANVLVSNDGEVKILDFGLAEFMEHSLIASSEDSMASAPPTATDDTAAKASKGDGNARAGVIDGSKASQDCQHGTPGADGAAGEAADDRANGQQANDRANDGVEDRDRGISETMPAPVSGDADTLNGEDSHGSPIGEMPEAAPSRVDRMKSPSLTQFLAETPAIETPAVERTRNSFAQSSMSNSGASGQTHNRPHRNKNVVWGTPHYLAPELWRGESATRRSDLYAVGALLYEILVGRTPHFRVPIADLGRRSNEIDCQPLNEAVDEEVPAKFADVIDRCLCREPARRFASADAMRSALEDIRDSGARVTIPSGNPYRGLQAFDDEHRGVFFGRRAEIGTVIERLRSDSFVLVVGDSGVGKSSLCRAGVVPFVVHDNALNDDKDWLYAKLVPGSTPFSNLLSALSSAGIASLPELRRHVRDNPQALPRIIRSSIDMKKRGLLLFVDQFEEMVTLGDEEEREYASEALAAMLNHLGSFKLLAAARSDFLGKVAAISRLGDDISRAICLLRPMSREKIRDAVVGPALTQNVSFESEELIESLIDAADGAEGGLPLLQFALAELWDTRAAETDPISRAALKEIGGVAGALSRHADHVIAMLDPAQRKAAREILLSLVTADGLRNRRSSEVLVEGGEVYRQALQALVRERLVVGSDDVHGAVYTVAHEALVRRWGTLRRWLDEHAGVRLVRQRLRHAAADWIRLERSDEALWSERRLAEAKVLANEALRPEEHAFLDASRRAATRRRRRRWVLVIGIPLFLIGVLIALQIRAKDKLEQRVNERIEASEAVLRAAIAKQALAMETRQRTFDSFDSGDNKLGEQLWRHVQTVTAETDRLLRESLQALDEAMAIDGSRMDVRDRIGDVLLRRAIFAELLHRPAMRDELLERLPLYDSDGSRRQKWDTNAELTLTTNPSGARVQIAQYIKDGRDRYVQGVSQTLGRTPIVGSPLKKGSYLIVIEGADRVPVRYPIVLQRGEKLSVNIPMPTPDEMPEGFVYIPPGRFLVGSKDNDDLRTTALSAAPLHQVETGSYIIARNETTVGEWIEYLEATSVFENNPDGTLDPRVTSVGLKRRPDGKWRLTIRPPTSVVYEKDWQEELIYHKRQYNQSHHWLRLPVGGIDAAEATSYAAWLDETGDVPGARLCNGYEWERAARGADARIYTHGYALSPSEANIDESYGKTEDTIGPDEVGLHPASRSPFGIEDMVGNAYEWTTSVFSVGEFVLRGGGYFYDRFSGRVNYRAVVPDTFRDPVSGIRICASFTPGNRTSE